MNNGTRYDDKECRDVFKQLFPQGPTGRDVTQELAPNGWKSSACLSFFHPSVEQVYREQLNFHRNIESLQRGDKKSPERPKPTIESVRAEYKDAPIDANEELYRLMGLSLWDIFSNNHEVVGLDGRVLDIGSFRGAAGFIADWLNEHKGRRDYDDMDFYMGTIRIGPRGDLAPVYRLIFSRLKLHDFDWIYHFPRLYLTDFKRDHDDDQDGVREWENYNPSQAVSRELKEKKRNEEIEDMRRSLDESYLDSVRDAHNKPPPTIVAAYKHLYGKCPRGWPP